MTTPNFGLLGLSQPRDPGERFMEGFQIGRQRNALQNYAQNPDAAISQVMPVNPQLGFALQGQQQRERALDQRAIGQKQEHAAAEQEQQQALQLLGARFLGAASEGDYAVRRQAAISRGVPETAIPEQYDPGFVQMQNVIASTGAEGRETRVVGDSLVDASTGEVIFQNPYVTVRDANGQTIVVPRQRIDSYYGQAQGEIREGRTGTVDGRRVTVRGGVPVFDDTGEPVPPEQRGPASAPGGFPQ
jgi:hypothetical protein